MRTVGPDRLSFPDFDPPSGLGALGFYTRSAAAQQHFPPRLARPPDLPAYCRPEVLDDETLRGQAEPAVPRGDLGDRHDQVAVGGSADHPGAGVTHGSVVPAVRELLTLSR